MSIAEICRLIAIAFMYIVCFIVLGIPVLIFAGFIVCALLAIPLTPILWVIDKFRNRNPTPVPETPKNPV